MDELERPAKAAFGRRLSDLWLDGEEGKLHPSEWKLLDCAARGKVCVLGDKRPSYPNESNRVRAELLRFVALGGDDENPLHEAGIDLNGAWIDCASGVLNFFGCDVPENIGIYDSVIDGNLVLRDALLETFSLQGSSVRGVLADRCESTGSIHLNEGFRAFSEIRFLGAKIGGDFSCEGGHFGGTDDALSCDGIQIEGAVFLDDGFRALGSVRLVGAKIDGQLTCRSGYFLSKETSLNLGAASIANDVYFDSGFVSLGTVDLTNTNVGNDLELDGGTFAKKGQAILAPRCKVGGNLIFGDECRVAGEVSFQGASIGGDVTFRGTSLETKGVINFRNAEIGGMFVWREVAHVRGELNLAGASCRTINMDEKSWCKPSQIRLDACTYKGFSELPENCDAKFWKRFLERQPERHLESRFRPNPYTQLANVLDHMGHEQEARSVRIEHRRRQAYFTRKYEPVVDEPMARMMRILVVIWNFLQGLVVDYGYRPGKAMLYLFGVIAVGTLFYEAAARQGIMTPTHPLIFKELGKTIPAACGENWVYPDRKIAVSCAEAMPSEYSSFSAFIYSADIALPIVNFRMEDDWSPRVVDWETGQAPVSLGFIQTNWGWWIRSWEWVQIGLGWLLSLLFVSAVGGIIRR